MSANLLAMLDPWLHRLRIPHRFWWRLCDAYDISLGVPDTPENFPRRHGYVRLRHVYTGSSSYPESATCQHCGKTIDRASEPCMLIGAASLAPRRGHAL